MMLIPKAQVVSSKAEIKIFLSRFGFLFIDASFFTLSFVTKIMLAHRKKTKEKNIIVKAINPLPPIEAPAGLNKLD